MDRVIQKLVGLRARKNWALSHQKANAPACVARPAFMFYLGLSWVLTGATSIRGPIYFTQSTNSSMNLNLKLPLKMPKTVFDEVFGSHDPVRLTYGINYHNGSQAAEMNFVPVGWWEIQVSKELVPSAEESSLCLSLCFWWLLVVFSIPRLVDTFL